MTTIQATREAPAQHHAAAAADHRRPLTPAQLASAIRLGAIVVDARDADRFDQGHLPGAINIPWPAAEEAHAMLPANARIAVIGEHRAAALAAADRLNRHGCGQVLGMLEGGIDRWRSAGYPLRAGQAIGAARAARELAGGGVALIDVRPLADWIRGHVRGSVSMPLETLLGDRPRVPAMPMLVACANGERAAVAASALRAGGHSMVWRVSGCGTPELLRAGAVAGSL